MGKFWDFPLVPSQASSMSGKVDALFLYELAITVFFIALVCGLFLTLAVRYRRGTRVDRTNPIRTSLVLESLWIGVPLVLTMTMFFPGAVLFYQQYNPPTDASDVYVVAKQWMWKLKHPEGRREINELHVPLGRAVKLTMTSYDVIHSFYVPDFRMKQDVLPGRYTTTWFRPTKVGKYHLFCSEYCGTQHSMMGGWVYVMDPADYERWLAGGTSGGYSGGRQETSMAREGEELFVRNHCAGCHRGSQVVKAPQLQGVYGRPVPIQEGKDIRFVRADDRYIRDSILLPKSQVVAGYEPLMPSYKGVIDEEDLLKIIEYIKSIGPGGTER